jgi:membrane protein
MKKKISFKGILKILKEAGTGFSDDKVLKLSGSLAYFTVFSMGPMLIVIIFFADLFYGREAIEGSIYGQIKGFVGPDAAAQIQDIIKNASLSGKSNVTAVIGFVTLLFGATGVFAEIQDSINTIWNLKPKPKKGWLKMLLNRLLSFSVVVSLGFLLLVSLVITAVLEALSNKLFRMFPEITVVLVYIINLVVTFGVITLLFAIIFKVLPDAIIKWRDVITGAMVTAVLFMIGKFAITLYISNSSVGTAYGAAGSFMVLILWLYYSMAILFYGAEWAQVRARLNGASFEPAEHANRLVVEARDANDQTAKSKIANEAKSERMSGYTRDKQPRS